MKSCIFRATLLVQAVAVAGAIGFAAPASVALAQGSQGGKSESKAAASKSGSVAGVVVEAPPKLDRIPPAKKAALDAEAAKRKTWKKYRSAAPAATSAAAATATTTASARAENYPGLHSLASH
jgi:hypothetical protein